MKNQMLEKYLSKDQLKKQTGISVNERKIYTSSSLHWHNFIEIEFIISGEGEQILNGQTFSLHPGCLSIMRLTDFHQVTPTKNLELLNFMIEDSLISEEMLHKISVGNTLFFELDNEQSNEFEMLIRLCMTENQKPKSDIRYLKHLIICIFLKIIKMTPEKGKNSLDERPIQTALLYLHMHFRENPKLSDVAKIAHYNASHFSAIFHKELGSTYCEYLNSLKISYAKELLISTRLKISDICYKCGFTSHSNFLRLFKEKLGISPMQFRKGAVDKRADKEL